MTQLTICNTAVRQLDGLYSLNDLHKAAGSEAKHRPNYFIDLQQTKELTAEIEITGIPAISSKPKVGTYVCRELVIAYAAWISPAFHLKVIRHFLDSKVGAGETALQAKGGLSKELRTHINRTAHQIALKQYDTIHQLLTECATDNLACGAKEAAVFGYIEAYADTADGVCIANVRDLKELVWNAEQVINTAAQAVANIRRIEQRSGYQLAMRIKRSEWENPEFHKHDRLVQEVLERMTADGT